MPTGSGHIHRDLLSMTIILEKRPGHLRLLSEVPLRRGDPGELPITAGPSRCIRHVEVEDHAGTGTSDDRLLRHRCRPSSRTGIGTEEIGQIGSRMSGASGSRRRRGEEGMGVDGMSSSRSTMNITIGSVVGSKGDGMRRPDISIGEASGTRSIPAAIAPTVVVNIVPPGAAIVTSTITRKNGAAVATRHAAGTHRQWSVEVHLLRRAIVAATAAVPCSTITNRQCHLSMTSAGATTAVPEVIVGIVTMDHLRPGWIAVEDDSSGVEEEEDQEVVDRSGEAAVEWIAVAAAAVGTTRMTSREATKWTTTGSHLAAVGKVVAKEENAVDPGHPTEGLRRGRDPANGTGTGVGEDGLVRQRHR